MSASNVVKKKEKKRIKKYEDGIIYYICRT